MITICFDTNCQKIQLHEKSVFFSKLYLWHKFEKRAFFRKSWISSKEVDFSSNCIFRKKFSYSLSIFAINSKSIIAICMLAKQSFSSTRKSQIRSWCDFSGCFFGVLFFKIFFQNFQIFQIFEFVFSLYAKIVRKTVRKMERKTGTISTLFLVR